ncbi:DEAD/DEAH box helicase [Spirochaetia bacterium]|nr:DEAD/DEAH box helicase [Spirochaetia bacterium]
MMLSNYIEGLTNLFDNKLLERRIEKPTEVQLLVIPHILKNNSIIFRSETGTGKTFAYLLPLLQHLAGDISKKALILAPTLELAAQIKKEAEFLVSAEGFEKIKIGLFTGAVNLQRQIDGLKKYKPSLLIGNTNRIVQLAETKKIKLEMINYAVLDECDRLISEELIESTKKVLSFTNNDRCIIACSATVSAKNKDIVKNLSGGDFIFVETDTNEILREKITHLAIWSEERRKIETLRSLLSALNSKRTLCFTDRGDQVTNIVSKLQHHKYKAAALFSGMDKKERKDALEHFRSGKINILVSSDLAARGLDIDNVSYVVSVGIPLDSDGYIHRAGRTARAGKKGTIISIGTENEMRRLLTIEKRLKLVIYPKVLYNGSMISPEDIAEDV